MTSVRRKQKKSITAPPSPESAQTLVHFAPELFIKICANLYPKDLLSLAQVCRLFHSYLTSENSTSTNLIWKQARERFLPHYSLLAPEGMSERQYIRLIVERDCQVCGKLMKGRGAHVYFEFRVRCCSGCASKNMTDGSGLSIPCPLLYRAPHCKFGRRLTPYYWRPQVEQLFKEFQTISKEEAENWLSELYHKTKATMEDARQRYRNKQIHDQARTKENVQKKDARLDEFLRRINEMLKETNADGSQRWNQDIIRNISTYEETMCSYRNTNPLTERSWKILRGKIEHEYMFEETRRKEIYEIL